MDNIFLDQFDQFYSHLLELADLARRFDDEKIDMSGLTFRTLMEESATLVIANYVTIQEHCENQWNFHSAFFFAGTVGEDAQIIEYLNKTLQARTGTRRSCTFSCLFHNNLSFKLLWN